MLPRLTTARVACASNVRVLRPGAGDQLANVSLGGMLLVTGGAFAVGEQVPVEFELPELGKVNGVGRTVRVERAPVECPELRVGIAFERLDEDGPEVLRQYIQARVGAAAERGLGEAPLAAQS